MSNYTLKGYKEKYFNLKQGHHSLYICNYFHVDVFSLIYLQVKYFIKPQTIKCTRVLVCIYYGFGLGSFI